MSLLTPMADFYPSTAAVIGFAAVIIILGLMMLTILVEFRQNNIGYHKTFMMGISILIGLGVIFWFLPNYLSRLLQMLIHIVHKGWLIEI